MERETERKYVVGRWDGKGAPLFELGNVLYVALGVRDHFAKEVGEAGLAQLGRLCAVQGPVVDCLAVGGVSQAGRLLARDALRRW